MSTPKALYRYPLRELKSKQKHSGQKKSCLSDQFSISWFLFLPQDPFFAPNIRLNLVAKSAKKYLVKLTPFDFASGQDRTWIIL